MRALITRSMVLFVAIAWLTCLAGIGTACVRCAVRANREATARPPAVTITHGRFHGWDALTLRNRAVEVTVVPAIGRIMQMAFASGTDAGAEAGPFWSAPGIGPALAVDENGWRNLGGDKAWPAPQADWSARTGRDWPPPATFDAAPFQATITGDAVVLTSAVDPAYGVRVRRTIALDPTEPVMTVETAFEKVSGPPARIGVWTITQLTAPERVFMRVPSRSAFPDGYAQRLPDPPKDLRVEPLVASNSGARLVGLGRDANAKTMIAGDGDALLWVSGRTALRIERVADANADDANAVWPDGAHAQIYTSSDRALPYVELELFSPLHELGPGQHAHLTVRYTLLARGEGDVAAEARRVLGP